jgi:peptidoglycan/LPS O-acetylase OafA/YrhL
VSRNKECPTPSPNNAARTQHGEVSGSRSSFRKPNAATTFRPDIEGLRALAIILVVANHISPDRVPSGFVGVDIFFVLSGYLITLLLVNERERSGSIDLANFYARRVRRLLPAAAAMTLTTLLIAMFVFSPSELEFSAKGARAAALYVSNLFFAGNASDYFATDTQQNLFLHTWSLAVEEQFYFVWPTVILISAARSKSAKGIVVALLAIAAFSLAMSIYLSPRNASFAYFMLPTRAWEFAIGGIACLIPSRARPLTLLSNVTMTSIGSLVVVLSAWWIPRNADYPGFIALLPVLSTAACLYLLQTNTKNPVRTFLATWPAQWLGKMSYSWYLWHWPFIVLGSALYPHSSSARLLAALLSLGVAAASFYFLEQPLRFNARLVSDVRRSLALGLALTLATVTAAQFLLRLARQESNAPRMHSVTAALHSESTLPLGRCATIGNSPIVKTCEFGSPHSSSTVVLFGDSHAISLFDALRSVAEERGWRMVTFIKSGCPATNVRVERRGWGSDFPDSCDSWRRDAIRHIQALAPSMTIVVEATEYVQGHGTGEESWAGVSMLDWTLGTRYSLHELSKSGSLLILVRDNPEFVSSVPECVGRSFAHYWYSLSNCLMPRRDALNTQLWSQISKSLVSLDNVTILDLTEVLCPGSSCPVLDKGYIMYRDTNHLSESYSLTLAPLLNAQLQAINRVPR